MAELIGEFRRDQVVHLYDWVTGRTSARSFSPSRTSSRRSGHRSQRSSSSRRSTRRSSTRSRSRRSRRSPRRSSRRDIGHRSLSISASNGSRQSWPRRSLSNRNSDVVSIHPGQNDDAVLKNNEDPGVDNNSNGDVVEVIQQAPAETGAVGTDAVPAGLQEHEIELQQEVLEVIGARLESDKKHAAAIHKDIALRWAEILRNGLPAEEVKKLLTKHPPPENCTFISVPKLNAEIIAAVQETAIRRDKGIVEKQERIAACLAALGRAISIVLKMEGAHRIELLENLSEGSRLLASVHREESLARKSLILANINPSLKTTLSNTSVDELLFGDNLEEIIKTAKSLERASKDLKPQTKTPQQRNPKNWKGPTRQPAYKNRSTTSGGYRRQSSNASDPKKPPYRKEIPRYKKRG